MKIKIAGHKYSVRCRKNLIRDFDAQGMSQDTNTSIIIDASGKKSHRQEIIAHEIVEQWNCRYELGLSHDKITTIGTLLFQLLKDNPKLQEKFS
jgi:hypothetical protein